MACVENGSVGVLFENVMGPLVELTTESKGSMQQVEVRRDRI